MSNRIHNFRITEKMNRTADAAKVAAPVKKVEVKTEAPVQSKPVEKKKTVDTSKVLKEITEAQEAIADFAEDVAGK